jgi:uncharacterized membrane protein YbhN (UPF0104 family)
MIKQIDSKLMRQVCSIIRTIIVSIIKYVIIIAIIYFIGRLIWIDRIEIILYFKNAKPLFYYSVAALSTFLCIQAWIWLNLLNSPDRQIGTFRGITVYVYSQFAKYLPGAVWNLVGRMMLAQKHGATRVSQLRSIYYENVLLVCVALVYGIFLFEKLNVIGWPIFLLFCALIGLFYLFYNTGMRWSDRVMHRFWPKLLNTQLQYPRRKFFSYFLYYMVSHLVMGFAFWLLLRSFGVVNVDIWEATGTFALAWLLGLISPLPGGIGLREGAITYLLSLQMDLELAYRIAIIARLWSLFAEILLFGILRAIDYILKVRNPHYESTKN